MTLWETATDADASAAFGRDKAAVVRWATFVEPSSVSIARYDTLD